MTPFHDDGGGWPPLAGVAALLGAAVLGVLVPVLAAVVGSLAGAGGTTPALALLSSLLFAAGVVLLVVRLAALTQPLTPRQLGLRAPAAPVRALALTAGAAVVLGTLVAVLALLGDLRAALPVPDELDPRSALAQAYDLPVRDAVPLGPGLIASALASCVLPVLAGELLLRGFAFPALSRWKGVWPAGLVVAVIFGGVAGLGDSAALALVSMVLGVLLCGLYLATGSLLPGLGLAAAAASAAFGVACGLSPLGVAAMVVACVAAVLGLAAPFTPWRGSPASAGAGLHPA